MRHLLLLLCCLLLSACGYQPHDASIHERHDAALSQFSDRTVVRGSETEQQAIQAFIDLFAVFERERLAGGITALYAEDAYFRDAFVEFNNSADIEDYFVRSTEPVEFCTFDIVDVAENEGHYYFRWIMTLKLNRYPNRPPNVTHGITHLRFNEAGQIVFHQDYWDAAALYKEFPVIGGLLRYIEKQIH